MQSNSISIQLDGADVFRPGGEMVGQVIARLEEPRPCSRLEIRAVLEVRSQNGTRRQEGTAVPLFSGTWSAGETAHPFRIPAPSAPFEHLGKHLSVSWVLEAWADVPWAKDLKTNTHIQLKATDSCELQVTAEPPPPEAEEAKKESGRLSLLLFGSLLLGCVGATVYGIINGDIEGILGGLAGAAVFSLFLYAMSLSDADEAAARKIDRVIGRPRLLVQQRRRGGYREGEETSALECTLHVLPSAPALVVRAALMVEERVVVFRGGEHRRSENYLDMLHGANCELVLKEPGVYRGVLPLPTGDQVPCSVEAGRDGIFWTVEATVSQEGKRWSRGAKTKLHVSPA